MGLFSRKDWNVVAIIFEKPDLYRINGNRSKGSDAAKSRDGAKNLDRTIYWAVFDQHGAFLEGGPGKGGRQIDAAALQRLQRELVTNNSVREVLRQLETGDSNRISRQLVWGGYPGQQPQEQP
jgi:hypothetical protein